MSDDVGGIWRTVGGRRIFIKDGVDLQTAMKESGKFKRVDKGKTKEEMVEDIKKKDELYQKKMAEQRTKENKNEFKSKVEDKEKVIDKQKSNELKEFKKEKLDEEKVRSRGGLTPEEAKEASKEASRIYEMAEKVEPEISRDLIGSVSKYNGEMYGLDFRLKQPTSLAGKIGADFKEAKGAKTTMKMYADNIKDAVRYTAILNEDSFVKDYNGIKADLESKGYKEFRCKNFYKMYDENLSCQKAIQCVYENKDGYKFELQFHTNNSQGAKDVNHLDLKLYDRFREAGTPRNEKMKLYGQMCEIAELVRNPNGIYTIKEH